MTLPGFAFHPDGPAAWVTCTDPKPAPTLTIADVGVSLPAPWSNFLPDSTAPPYVQSTTCSWDVWNLAPIVVALNLPNGGYYSPNDPTFRVTWNLSRLDTNQVLLEKDVSVAAPNALSVSIDHSSPTLGAIPQFFVTCKLYRALGYTTQQVAQFEVEILIEDWVDRSRKFIQWNHDVWFISGTSEPPLVPIPGAVFWTRTRLSKIHRTDVPGRCLSMRYVPWYKGRKVWNVMNPFSGTYFENHIPFPSSELAEQRHGILCDYCFFGGPTSTTPKIPPGQTLEEWLGT
jgi:hypothetical protein